MSHKGPVARVDWFQVLVDLQRRGYPAHSVALQIGVARPTLLNWKNHGAEPRHVDGEKLLAFWARIVEQPIERAPRTHAPAWLR